MGGQPSNARTAMFELCRAVNERQGALGIAKTTFRKADGSTAADLTTDDLAGIKCTGSGSGAYLNLTAIKSSIISMVNAGYFLETSAGTPWTKNSLESDIGTDLDANPLRPQEARYWQAMQDALDRLIYGRVTVTPSYVSATREDHTSSTVAVVVSGSDYEDLWDDRNAVTALSGFPNEVGWVTRSYSSPTNGRGAQMRRKTSGIVIPTGTLDGVIASATYNYEATWEDYTGSQFEVTIGTSSAVCLSSGTGSVATTDLGVGSDTTVSMEVTESEPASVPFNKPGSGAPYTGEVLLSFNSVTINLDLASILTDQA